MINDYIRFPEVRLLDADKGQLGIVSSNTARDMAEEAGLDLVCVGVHLVAESWAQLADWFLGVQALGDVWPRISPGVLRWRGARLWQRGRLRGEDSSRA